MPIFAPDKQLPAQRRFAAFIMLIIHFEVGSVLHQPLFAIFRRYSDKGMNSKECPTSRSSTLLK